MIQRFGLFLVFFFMLLDDDTSGIGIKKKKQPTMLSVFWDATRGPAADFSGSCDAGCFG